MVTINEFLLIVNAIACGVTATSLGTYQRRGSTHKLIGAITAFVLMVACGAITILIICGRYSVANPAEAIINVVLCISVVQARGNAMRIFWRDEVPPKK